MWGNWLGWFLAACEVAVLSLVLWPAIRTPPVSEPSGAFPDLLSRVSLPVDVRTAAPETMTDNCDAGELYRQAIDEYRAKARVYDNYASKPRTAQKDKPRAVEMLTDAAKCSRMVLFRRTPAEVLNYQPDTPALEAIEKLGRIANQLGLLYRLDKDPDGARRYFHAAFALGYHLYDERLAWAEFTAGINLMTDAARGLAKLEADAGNAGWAKSLGHLADEADKYKLKQYELYKVVSTIDSDTVGRHGGDIIALAKSSPEPMWRGEAILALGRMKYNTPRRGDQLAAGRLVNQLANDPDPVVRSAAIAAAALTMTQYRGLR